MTAVMFVVGFILLLIGGKADDAAEAGRSSMGMAASVVGLFLWIGGLITGIIAVTVSIRSYLSRARTSTGLL
jgi:hypothetical protein